MLQPNKKKRNKNQVFSIRWDIMYCVLFRFIHFRGCFTWILSENKKNYLELRFICDDPLFYRFFNWSNVLLFVSSILFVFSFCFVFLPIQVLLFLFFSFSSYSLISHCVYCSHSRMTIIYIVTVHTHSIYIVIVYKETIDDQYTILNQCSFYIHLSLFIEHQVSV